MTVLLSFLRSLASIMLSPLRHRTLFLQFTRREIAERHRGSFIGFAWAIINPLMMLLIYSFVFIGVFRMKWPGAENVTGPAYALRLFCGLVVFNLFAEVLSRAASLISSQPNLVKKVQFPLELLSFVSVASALFHFAVALGILLAFSFVFERLSWSVLYVPLILLPLPLLMLGLSLMLSAVGVYVRDTAQIMTLIVNFTLFLSPVFYTTMHLTGGIKRFIQFNPLAGVIENLRCSLFADASLDWGSWSYSLGVSAAVCVLGACVFVVLRDGFSDVL